MMVCGGPPRGLVPIMIMLRHQPSPRPDSSRSRTRSDGWSWMDPSYFNLLGPSPHLHHAPLPPVSPKYPRSQCTPHFAPKPRPCSLTQPSGLAPQKSHPYITNVRHHRRDRFFVCRYMRMGYKFGEKKNLHHSSTWRPLRITSAPCMKYFDSPVSPGKAAASARAGRRPPQAVGHPVTAQASSCVLCFARPEPFTKSGLSGRAVP
jgi:hypothetical protein